MVKFRGVNVHIVSQFEAVRLPEYGTTQGVENGQHIVAHYVPIHTGAQIWFEYSIDGPHPPNAMYLLKLFINGENITNWDCTTKHDYHGKAMCSLQTIEYGSFKQRAVLQNVFMFSSEEQSASPNTKDHNFEIRVHRVQQRRRVRELPIDPDLVQQLQHTRNSLR
ncbi:hypothetical protein LTS08_000752 [Lithohypha guttulata]|nr:hypothetical protein LTS08_000752 [Lithohypha guttulata]